MLHNAALNGRACANRDMHASTHVTASLANSALVVVRLLDFDLARGVEYQPAVQ